ncbi:hypothetical protein GCM10027176_02230 [Actinoallomurus bryophytorum]|uniref:Subtilase family protein n=1 Tax=Actinoallomurus bryophytorum TaxID=1490222 RepID=A0A543CK65_9ACTN|nr:S8 family serine peptidase [Actinoallomurus bryophytorum]TQL97496.1 subtilase family protein [Actinoallomurus bryophytorum]
MSTTLLLTVQSDDEDAAVRETGIEVLARYPDAILVRGTHEQAGSLERLGMETIPLADRPVVTTGNAFSFADAVRAQEVAAVEPAPDRPAYYLARLAGPPAAEWLRELGALGAQVHDSLPGFTLLVGIRPEHLGELEALSWVEDVTPYRPAMKVSPKVHSTARSNLGIADLANLPERDGSERQLVEVSVFAGESLQDAVAQVRGSGGTVLSTTGRALVASVPSGAVARLAGLQGVVAILPYAFPRPHNDQARRVLGVPPDNSFAGHSLTGAGQIVAIADSGLDTGDPETLHADIRGRVAGIISWPTRPDLADLVTDPPEHDDGPSDVDSGHGTHVTGSVLGDGSAARDAGATVVPAGVAPEAQVFFQAVSQRLHWKSAEQLVAEGKEVPDDPWPPAEEGLWGLPLDLAVLFQQAYRAGARVHTNSWGSSVAGSYTNEARAVDDFAWHHPDMLILFSAGNDGVDTDIDGVIDEDSVSSPGSAKNCLTVGAGENTRPSGSTPPPGRDGRWDQLKAKDGTLRWPHLGAAGHISDNADGMAAFSSRGPVDGDRIKPDVVAPGTNILSTLSSALPADFNPLWGRLPAEHPLRRFYCWSGGTSMATPLVAGAAALVRQQLVRDHGHEPSSALVKAFLVTGAAPMTGQFAGEVPTGSNDVSGFGRVDVASTVAALSSKRTVFADDPADAVMSGERRIYRIEEVDPDAPLVVTLVWTDAPSALGGLVNQLYLSVQTPDGTYLDGDVSPFPNPVNNVQRVVIPAPAAGAHVIRVFGTSVITTSTRVTSAVGERQDFAIVVAGGTSLTRIR